MQSEDLGPITRTLHDMQAGDASAQERLIELVYDDLRRMANKRMRDERADHTLQPTALVNEAWLRLRCAGVLDKPRSRQFFFYAAATAMRRVLREHARARKAQKRPTSAQQVPLDETLKWFMDQGLEPLAFDKALTKLADLNERQAQVIQLRFYAGLSVAQIAELVDVSAKSIERDLRMARAWLKTHLTPSA